MRVVATLGDNPTVNYEDRTDLLSPDAVVSSGVLERLRSEDSDPLGCLNEVGEPQVTSAVARAVIATFIASEAAIGAPEAALPAEQDAAECGYAFGRLFLGPLAGDRMTSEQVSSDLNRMYLFALVDLVGEGTPSFGTHLSAYLRERARLFPEAEALAGAFEEAAYLAWCTGFGTAAVLAGHK